MNDRAPAPAGAESGAAPGRAAAAGRLRFASYNVHGCVGRDQRWNPERVVAVLRELQADVIALQEVPYLTEHGERFLERAAAAVGMQVIAGPLARHRGARDANALLTRLPVLEVRHLDLQVSGYAPRGAVDADLGWGESRLRVVATHLGLRPKERRIQIRRLLRQLNRGGTVVLLGDINEWFVWGRPLRWLHAHFRRAPAPRSFPSGLPVFALDRIWVSRPGRVVSMEAWRSELARVASDHLPVRAVVELPLSAA